MKRHTIDRMLAARLVRSIRNRDWAALRESLILADGRADTWDDFRARFENGTAAEFAESLAADAWDAVARLAAESWDEYHERSRRPIPRAAD